MPALDDGAVHVPQRRSMQPGPTVCVPRSHTPTVGPGGLDSFGPAAGVLARLLSFCSLCACALFFVLREPVC